MKHRRSQQILVASILFTGLLAACGIQPLESRSLSTTEAPPAGSGSQPTLQRPIVLTAASSTLQTSTPPPLSVRVAQGHGALSFRAPEGCRNSFGILSQGQVLANSRIGTPVTLPAGSYDIRVGIEFQAADADRQVVVGVALREGEETTIDLTEQLGGLVVERYALATVQYSSLYYGWSGLDRSVGVEPAGLRRVAAVEHGETSCGAPGNYTIVLNAVNGPAVLEVSVVGGRTTTVTTEQFPKAFGVLQTRGRASGGSYRLFDQQAGRLVGASSGSATWVWEGTYRLVFETPVVAVFDDVAIVGGRITVVELPS